MPSIIPAANSQRKGKQSGPSPPTKVHKAYKEKQRQQVQRRIVTLRCLRLTFHLS